jgi:hypothetical protein
MLIRMTMRISLAAGFAASFSAVAGPADAIPALSAAMGAANQLIPRNSSCFGLYTATTRPKVRDLLASRLAFLHSGTNVVEGSCAKNHCTIEIRHAAGEDVSSLRIDFPVANEIAVASRMQCVMTP